jgi:hypothetical protein
MFNDFVQQNTQQNIQQNSNVKLNSKIIKYTKTKIDFVVAKNKTKIEIKSMPKSKISFLVHKTNKRVLQFTNNSIKNININTNNNNKTNKTLQNIQISNTIDLKSFSNQLQTSSSKAQRETVIANALQQSLKTNVVAITAAGPIELTREIFAQPILKISKISENISEQQAQATTFSKKSIWRNAGFNLTKQFLNASISYAGKNYLSNIITAAIPSVAGPAAEIAAASIIPLLLATTSFVIDNKFISLTTEEQSDFALGVKTAYISSFVGQSLDYLTGGLSTATSSIFSMAFDSSIKSNISNLIIGAVSTPNSRINVDTLRERKREHVWGELNAEEFNNSKQSLVLGLVASSLSAFSLSKYGLNSLSEINGSKIALQNAAQLARDSAELLFKQSGIDINPINKTLKTAKNNLIDLLTLEALEGYTTTKSILNFTSKIGVDTLKNATGEFLTANVLKNDYITKSDIKKDFLKSKAMINGAIDFIDKHSKLTLENLYKLGNDLNIEPVILNHPSNLLKADLKNLRISQERQQRELNVENGLRDTYRKEAEYRFYEDEFSDPLQKLRTDAIKKASEQGVAFDQEMLNSKQKSYLKSRLVLQGRELEDSIPIANNIQRDNISSEAFENELETFKKIGAKASAAKLVDWATAYSELANELDVTIDVLKVEDVANHMANKIQGRSDWLSKIRLPSLLSPLISLKEQSSIMNTDEKIRIALHGQDQVNSVTRLLTAFNLKDEILTQGMTNQEKSAALTLAQNRNLQQVTNGVISKNIAVENIKKVSEIANLLEKMDSLQVSQKILNNVIDNLDKTASNREEAQNFNNRFLNEEKITIEQGNYKISRFLAGLSGSEYVSRNQAIYEAAFGRAAGRQRYNR